MDWFTVGIIVLIFLVGIIFIPLMLLLPIIAASCGASGAVNSANMEDMDGGIWVDEAQHITPEALEFLIKYNREKKKCLT